MQYVNMQYVNMQYVNVKMQYVNMQYVNMQYVNVNMQNLVCVLFVHPTFVSVLSHWKIKIGQFLFFHS